MEWIRKTYRVPAYRGVRVVYSGSGTDQYGTIKSASNGHLKILLDGAKHPALFHPTWQIRYLA